MYKIGHKKPFWLDHYKHLEYSRKSSGNSAEEARWRSQGFNHQWFTGEMSIIPHNTKSWAADLFNWFPGVNTGLTIYKMSTGVIMPTHIDKFSFYKTICNVHENQTIFRAIVFLEDWQSGHIFEIENNLFSSWNAGDYVVWDEQTPHMAANLGTSPRYTAQITFTDVS